MSPYLRQHVLLLDLWLCLPGAVVRAQGLYNSREEGKWVAQEAARIHKDKGIRYVYDELLCTSWTFASHLSRQRCGAS